MGKKRKNHNKTQKIYQSGNQSSLKDNWLDKNKLIYFVGIVAIFIYFLTNFFSLPDISNNYISSKASWILNLEVFINILLFSLMVYFGYNYIQKDNKSFDRYLIVLAFFGIVVIHLLAFNPAVDKAGDNGNYIYAAKSIATLGNTYRLPSPDLTPDRIVVGYPLILSLVYKIFGGINILAFKITTMILSLLSVFFFYLVMLKLIPKQAAIILTILYGIHPYVVVFSSMIMTETPTLFWGILTWYLTLKYKDSNKLNYKLLVLLSFSSIFTYLTRNIGVSILGTTSIFLFLQSKFLRGKFDLKSLAFKKFYLYTATVFVLFVLIQVRNTLFIGKSDTGVFLDSNWLSIFSKSFPLISSVFSENLFSFSVIRWQPFPSLTLKILISFVMLIGLGKGLYQKNFSSIYIVFFLIILMITTPVDNSSLVLSRYTVPLIPFYIFIFYDGLKVLSNKLKYFNKWGLLFGLLLLIISTFSGNGYLIQRSHIGKKYPPALASYFDCAKWINENLSSDVIVESRKSRIFFIFSESYSISNVGGGTTYSFEFENSIMKLVKAGELDYLVLDSFSGASFRCYVPLIKKYPQNFKLYKVFGDKYPCYLFKIEI